MWGLHLFVGSRNMNVYYRENFYGKGEGKTPLQKIELKKSFQWGDKTGVMFALYVGDEGVAVDIGLETQREEVEEFMTWYQQNWAGKEEQISHEEYEEIEERNPIGLSFRMKLSINEEELISDFSCGTTYCNLEAMRENARASHMDVEEQLLAEYGFDSNSAWYISRHFAKWNHVPTEIKTIKTILKEEEHIKRAEKLEIAIDSVGKCFDIKHPITGDIYQMQVLEVTQQEMDWDGLPMGKRRQDMILPQHYLEVVYQMTPQPDNQFFHFMAENGDAPKRKSTSMSASAVSIIGSSSGPTSVFIAGKKSESASIASGLFFEPVTEAKFTPTFMVTGRDDMEITISLEES